MRPRRFRRGIDHGGGQLDVGDRMASMRPRRFRRGIRRRLHPRADGGPRFNEAPAISPGNPPTGAMSSGRRFAALQ